MVKAKTRPTRGEAATEALEGTRRKTIETEDICKNLSNGWGMSRTGEHLKKGRNARTKLPQARPEEPVRGGWGLVSAPGSSLERG